MILTSDPHALVAKFLSFLPELEENALPDKVQKKKSEIYKTLRKAYLTTVFCGL